MTFDAWLLFVLLMFQTYQLYLVAVERDKFADEIINLKNLLKDTEQRADRLREQHTANKLQWRGDEDDE